MKAARSGRNNTVNLLVTLGVFLLVALVLIAGGLYGVRATFEDDALVVKAPLFEETVALGEIDSVELASHIAYGSRVGGSDFVRVKTGTFQNTAFGRYRCAVYTAPQTCIVVKHGDRILVFNLKTDDATEAFFEQLQAAL